MLAKGTAQPFQPRIEGSFEIRQLQLPAAQPFVERLAHMEIESGNTTYLTVADKDGNIVSLIQSIYSEFASGMVPDGLGFVLQNRGQMFNVQDKTHANATQRYHL